MALNPAKVQVPTSYCYVRSTAVMSTFGTLDAQIRMVPAG